VEEKACRICYRITEKDTCPNCGSHSLSYDFKGVVIIIDEKKSIIAKKLNITQPGKYALEVF